MDRLDDWFPIFRAAYVPSIGVCINRNPYLLESGIYISVQGGAGNYCEPKVGMRSLHEYISVEVALWAEGPDEKRIYISSQDIPELSNWDWTEDGVAGWVPVKDIPIVMQLVRQYQLKGAE